MVTVVQGKVCAKNHPDRLSHLATIHQRYRPRWKKIFFHRVTDGLISYGIGLDLTVGQKRCDYLTLKNFDDMFSRFDTILACDGQTDRRTDRRISCDSIIVGCSIKTDRSRYVTSPLVLETSLFLT